MAETPQEPVPAGAGLQGAQHQRDAKACAQAQFIGQEKAQINHKRGVKEICPIHLRFTLFEKVRSPPRDYLNASKLSVLPCVR